jgi:uncharacterized protein YeaO (DUF488 family)
MAICIIQLGTARESLHRLRLGTVRRPPRGVPKAEFATRGFYDVWLPILSPSPKLVAQGRAATGAQQWRAFVRAFEKEMAAADAARTLDLLAALSHRTDIELGCYCKDEASCHRSVLRRLLEARNAALVPAHDIRPAGLLDVADRSRS